MGYLLGFAFAYLGYSLITHGHYVWDHQPKNLWWLLSGLGPESSSTSSNPNNSGQAVKGAGQPGNAPSAPLI